MCLTGRSYPVTNYFLSRRAGSDAFVITKVAQGSEKKVFLQHP